MSLEAHKLGSLNLQVTTPSKVSKHVLQIWAAPNSLLYTAFLEV